MNWYAVKIIFQIEDKDKTYPQFDEQIRLIDAVNEELALEMAYQLGMMQQEEVLSSNQQRLNWRFVAVTEIQHVGEIQHGSEIHYQITEPEEINTYLQLIRDKAESLKNRKLLKN